MTKLVLPSPAKLNLFLHINGRRDDGYHQLQTLFQFLDYGDTLTFETTTDNQISLNCSLPELNTDDNLILRSARLLQTRYAPDQGIRIELDKRLPMGGGVGGGSSNAATTLLALNRLWQLNLDPQTLATIGLSLGADVPVFVHGKAVFAEGVGEIFSPVTPEQPWYLVAKPPCHVSTAAIFSHPDLPRNTPMISPQQYHFEQTHNDCQALVKKLYPEVANTIKRLLEYAPTRLTGTGACVFSVFAQEKQAQQALACLPPQVSGFIAQGQNVSATHIALDQMYQT